MAREQRAESLDSIVTDDSEDPLTCPLTQRLFHDPVILVASGEAPCINQIVAAPLRHCGIMASTPSTRRRLDGVAVRSMTARFSQHRTQA